MRSASVPFRPADYFDYVAGVDGRNRPDKPLPAGAIAPDAALLFSGLLYCAVLIAACLMDASAARRVVAFSAAATLLYTPVFKKLAAVKNATVASVVALAPVAGALAAGAVRETVQLGGCGACECCTCFMRQLSSVVRCYSLPRCQRVFTSQPLQRSPGSACPNGEFLLENEVNATRSLLKVESCSPQGEEGLRRLLAPSVFAFTGIMFREILMDVHDIEGDRLAGGTLGSENVVLKGLGQL